MHTLHTWAVLAAAVGALSGCAVGPQYATPTTAPIALASAQTGAFSSTGVVHGQQPWWSFFDEERLTQRIALALAHNHDIRQAQANLLAARAVFDASALDRWPAVTAQAGYQRSVEQQAGANGSVARRPTESWRAGFDAQWEIDLFGRLERLSRSAQAQADAAQAELAQARLLIAADVARYHYEGLGLARRLEVAQAQVQSWQETLALIEARIAQGSGLPEDLENARANLLRSTAAIAPLAVALQQTQFRLDVLTGQRPGQQPLALEAAAPAPMARQLPLGDVDHLIRHRPDVVRAERLLAASTENVGAATAELYPRLDLGGFIGFFALGGGDIGSASRAFQFAPGIQWPALRIGHARARLRATQAQSDGALARYEQALLQAQEEVEHAVTQLAQHQQRLAALLQSATHARAAQDIAGKRYRAGAGSYLAVLENQRALFQIRQELAEAETASYVHVIALYKALGWGTGQPA